MGKVKASDHAELTDFKALSFDVYSTLIDEPGKTSMLLLTYFPHSPNSLFFFSPIMRSKLFPSSFHFLTQIP